MAMSQSIIEKGSDELDGNGTLKANTATKNKVIDFCTFCIPRGTPQPATHFCFECGPFGRYICGLCEQNHEMFLSDHTVKRITEAKGEPRPTLGLREPTPLKISVHQELDTLREKYNELQIQIESEREKSQKAIEKLNREKEHEMKRFEEEMKAKSKKMDQLKIEKDDYRDRFSKMARDKLTENNAYISDLSDPNSAMKLAEEFSGLYDDDWTDAYTTLRDKRMSVKDVTQLLLRILKSCYDTCEYIAEKQLEHLTTSLLYPVQTERQPTIRDQAALFEQTKEWMDKEIGPTVFEDTHAYIEKCVEVCWLMVVHEPPVYLKTEITGERMDPNIYTAFSTSGKKIKYLVWPPLYNGKSGGLLSKGVVELLKTVTKDGEKKK